MDCDVGMFRGAGRGGRKAEAVRGGSLGQGLSRRNRRVATGRTRSQGLVRPRRDRRPESGRGGSRPAAGVSVTDLPMHVTAARSLAFGARTPW